ncbi:hypothetical protein [Alishewanella sp. HL-SH05]|uniref:hypothetical protein n=1 Tax=Alishewanella sp. HL-SH05 TaxID=3461145 RepID=UPI004041218E
MPDKSYEVECCEHGKVPATFVCCHILENDCTEWYSSEIQADDPFPDAWCEKCHVHFEKFGEWTEEAENAAGGSDSLRILCCMCYVHKMCTFNVHVVE